MVYLVELALMLFNRMKRPNLQINARGTTSQIACSMSSFEKDAKLRTRAQ